MPTPCVALLLALLLVVGSSAVDDKQAKCNELGFVSTVVACSDCEILAQFVKDEELVRDCKGCCVQDETVKKYAKVMGAGGWRAKAGTSYGHQCHWQLAHCCPTLMVTLIGIPVRD